MILLLSFPRSFQFLACQDQRGVEQNVLLIPSAFVWLGHPLGHPPQKILGGETAERFVFVIAPMDFDLAPVLVTVLGKQVLGIGALIDWLAQKRRRSLIALARAHFAVFLNWIRCVRAAAFFVGLVIFP